MRASNKAFGRFDDSLERDTEDSGRLCTGLPFYELTTCTHSFIHSFIHHTDKKEFQPPGCTPYLRESVGLLLRQS